MTICLQTSIVVVFNLVVSDVCNHQLNKGSAFKGIDKLLIGINVTLQKVQNQHGESFYLARKEELHHCSQIKAENVSPNSRKKPFSLTHLTVK
jgi:hypothetical protein